MDVALVRQERALTVPYPVDEYPHHVHARNHQRAERQEERMHAREARVRRRDVHLRHPKAQGAEDDADRQGTRVAHEYLLLLLGLAEHVVVEERYDRAQRRERQQGESVLPHLEEDAPVIAKSDPAEAGRQSVDAVYQVHRVDDEYNQQNRQRPKHHDRQTVEQQQTVEVRQVQSAEEEEQAARDLNHELRTVLHSDQVVRYADQIQKNQRAEADRQTQHVRSHLSHQQLTAGMNVEHQQDEYREHDHRLERQTSQSGYRAMVYLALVRLVEQFLTKCYQQYLRYQDSRRYYRHH